MKELLKSLLRAQRNFLLEKEIGRKAIIFLPYAWLICFFLVPFFIILKISLSEPTIAMPPFKPLWTWVDDGILQIRLFLNTYQIIFDDDLYIFAYLESIKIAGAATFFCLLIGYPMAYGISRSSPKKQNILLLMVILPFWTSFLLRIYAWMGILSPTGILNKGLMLLGVIDTPLKLMQTDFAVCLGMVYCYLPFMIFPLYASLEKFDYSLLEAAADLGCKPWKAFIKITLPLTSRAMVTGAMLVFIPATGEFVIPELLGSSKTLMLGKVIWTEFFTNRDWPMAATLSILVLVLLLLPVMIFQRTRKEKP
jgi:putrescine transport system permease protein